MEIIPYPHQIEGEKILAEKSAWALFWDMGTGKTRTVVRDLLNRKRRGERISGGLVVCLNRVKSQWEKQVPQHSDGELTVLVPRGTIAQRIKQIEEGQHDVYVLNYEALPHMQEYLKRKKGGWPFLILDESTAIANYGALRTKISLALSGISKVRRIMTGLPNPNDAAIQLYTQLTFLDPMIFGGNYYRFKDRYCILGGFEKREIIGYRNLDELTEKVKSISTYVPEDVLGLPPKVFYDEDVELTGETLHHYEAMREDLQTWWTDHHGEKKLSVATMAITQILRLAQIAGGTVQSGGDVIFIKDTPKLKTLDDLLEQATQKGGKAVVFAIYKEEIRQIVARYPQLSPRAIFGDVPEKVSTQSWQDFQTPGDPGQLMVCQSHSGGIGIDLYAARTAIFYTRDFSLEAYRQPIKRLHRIGQKGTVKIHHLISKIPNKKGRRRTSIDETISMALARKQKLASGVLTGKFTSREIVAMVEEALSD